MRPFFIWIPTGSGFGYAHVENFKPFPSSQHWKDQPKQEQEKKTQKPKKNKPKKK